jgi:flagellar basal body-associated protein FliL
MAEKFQSSENSGTGRSSSKVWLIVVIVVVVCCLCAACLAAGWWLYENGDQLLEQFQDWSAFSPFFLT